MMGAVTTDFPSEYVSVAQGSPEWLAHRRAHWNASDAPAMMGESAHEKRNELLARLHAGVDREFSDYVQDRVIDAGHRFEALARPHAELLLGQELSPLTVARGLLSASLDGHTLDGSIDWEHKSLNATLADHLPHEGVGGPHIGAKLPLMYRIQIAHEQYCSGAARTLFTASEWRGDELVDMRHCWVERDHELIAKVLSGWLQFGLDLRAYVPPAAAAVVIALPQHLPSASVTVGGALTVASNLDVFGAALRAFVARIPKSPTTDQEFADADQAVKALERAEESLKSAEEVALSSIPDVEQLRRTLAELRDIARTTRLATSKLVDARKKQIREDEVRRGALALNAHLAALCDRLGEPVDIRVPVDFGGAIKGLKSLDSLRDAIDTALSRAKIEANEIADRAEINLRLMSDAGDRASFPDRLVLALKATDDLGAVIAARAAEEAARVERIRQAEAAKDAQPPVSSGERQAPAVPAESSPPTAHEATVGALAAPSASEPSMSIGALNDRLGGVQVKPELLASLGFPFRAERAAKLYRAADFGAICAALAQHIVSRSAQ